MAGSSWPDLVAGRTAKASEVEAKFDWIEGDIVPQTGGNQTDSVYNLGTTGARWLGVYTRSINPTSTAGGVAIGTTTCDASAILELAGVKAIILPRLSTAERDALTPKNGMLIYNSNSAAFQKYENGAWRNMGGATHGFVGKLSTSTAGAVGATETAYSYAGSGRLIGLQFGKSATNPMACSLEIDGTSYAITSVGSGAGNYKTTLLGATTTTEVFANFSGTAAFTELGPLGISFKSSLKIYFTATSPDVNTAKFLVEHD